MCSAPELVFLPAARPTASTRSPPTFPPPTYLAATSPCCCALLFSALLCSALSKHARPSPRVFACCYAGETRRHCTPSADLANPPIQSPGSHGHALALAGSVIVCICNGICVCICDSTATAPHLRHSALFCLALLALPCLAVRPDSRAERESQLDTTTTISLSATSAPADRHRPSSRSSSSSSPQHAARTAHNVPRLGTARRAPCRLLPVATASQPTATRPSPAVQRPQPRQRPRPEQAAPYPSQLSRPEAAPRSLGTLHPLTALAPPSCYYLISIPRCPHVVIVSCT